MITQVESWFAPRHLKNGKLGEGMHFERALYCPINTCERCGFMGGVRSVRYRSDVYGWAQLHVKDWESPKRTTLCNRCWGLVGHAWRMKQRAEELGALARKLLREIANGNKDRGTARVVDGLHRSGEEQENGRGRCNSDRQTGSTGEPVDAG